MVCSSAWDKKAEAIVIMEMKQRAAFCDYFILMSAPSTVRVKAIVDHIEEEFKKQDAPARHREGYQDALWVLLDYNEVVVHVFHEETRKFYNLESLWGDVHKRSFKKG